MDIAACWYLAVLFLFGFSWQPQSLSPECPLPPTSFSAPMPSLWLCQGFWLWLHEVVSQGVTAVCGSLKVNFSQLNTLLSHVIPSAHPHLQFNTYSLLLWLAKCPELSLKLSLLAASMNLLLPYGQGTEFCKCSTAENTPKEWEGEVVVTATQLGTLQPAAANGDDLYWDGTCGKFLLLAHQLLKPLVY